MAIYLESNEFGGGVVVNENNQIEIYHEPYQQMGAGSFGIAYTNINVSFENTSTGVTYNPAIQLTGSASNGSVIIQGSADRLAQAKNAVITPTSNKNSGGIDVRAGDISTYAGEITTSTDRYELTADQYYSITSPSIIFKRIYQEEEGGEQLTQTYRIEDFALKSDIPAGIDLTNYQGLISATNEFDGTTIGTSTLKLNTGFSYTSQFTQPDFANIEMKSTFSSFNMDMSCAVYVPQAGSGEYYNINTSSDLSGHYQIHTEYNASGSATSVNDPGNTEKYNLLIGGDRYDGLQFSYTTADNQMTPNLFVTPAKGFYISGKACAIGVSNIVQQDSISSSAGIWFKDNTIQSESFTLKSLVDRIAALETQVTELQSQLAAKANTANPTFTGKVSINS